LIDYESESAQIGGSVCVLLSHVCYLA